MKKLKLLSMMLIAILLFSTIVAAGVLDSLAGKLSLSFFKKSTETTKAGQIPSNAPIEQIPAGQGTGDVLQFGIYYKPFVSGSRIAHYKDYSGWDTNLMFINSYNRTFNVESEFPGDGLALKIKDSFIEIYSLWGINANRFHALGNNPATDEAGELMVYDNGVMVGNGNTNRYIALSNGLMVLDPKSHSAEDEVKFVANESGNYNEYNLYLDSTCDLSEAGYSDSVPCVVLHSSYTNAFVLLNGAVAREVYIVVKPVESAIPLCNDGIDNDGDGKADAQDPQCSICSDGDNGIDANSASQVLIRFNPDLPMAAYLDTCYNGILKEAVCTETGQVYVDYVCNVGQFCVNGKCSALQSGLQNSIPFTFYELQDAHGSLRVLLEKRNEMRQVALSNPDSVMPFSASKEMQDSNLLKKRIALKTADTNAKKMWLSAIKANGENPVSLNPASANGQRKENSGVAFVAKK